LRRSQCGAIEPDTLFSCPFGDLEKAGKIKDKLMRRGKLGLRIAGKDQR
jgi:hypothetical protein